MDRRDSRDAKNPSMFVFGSAANVSTQGNDSASGAAASASATGIPSFAFDASSLPPVNGGDAAATAGGFKLAAAATKKRGEAEDVPPLFGSTFKSTPARDVEEAIVKEKTEGGDESRSLFGSALGTRQDDARAGMTSETEKEETMKQSAPTATSTLLRSFISEEQLMNSGHELPESYICPLCCLPIALPLRGNSRFEPCCLKLVCEGCNLASGQRGMGKRCAFCRTPTPKSDAAMLALVQKRVNAKDPVAIEFLASAYYGGKHGLQRDIPRAIELWTEAARLGDLDAHANIGNIIFCYGNGVDQDKAKAIRHWQHAAMQGHPEARYILGIHEGLKENHELAVQHFMISAKMGYQDSLNEIKDLFVKGLATKEQYAEALKGYQNALEESKSPKREEAKAFFGPSG